MNEPQSVFIVGDSSITCTIADSYSNSKLDFATPMEQLERIKQKRVKLYHMTKPIRILLLKYWNLDNNFNNYLVSKFQDVNGESNASLEVEDNGLIILLM